MGTAMINTLKINIFKTIENVNKFAGFSHINLEMCHLPSILYRIKFFYLFILTSSAQNVLNLVSHLSHLHKCMYKAKKGLFFQEMQQEKQE